MLFQVPVGTHILACPRAPELPRASGTQDMLGQDSDDEMRTVLLVNCGATEDIRALLGLKAEARAYVIDAHRPVHLNNLSPANRQVSCLSPRAHERGTSAIRPALVVRPFHPMLPSCPCKPTRIQPRKPLKPGSP